MDRMGDRKGKVAAMHRASEGLTKQQALSSVKPYRPKQSFP